MVLAPAQFQSYVHDWAVNNSTRMHGVWPLKGGWEAWAQAEICSVINAAQPTSDVLREQPIYSDAALRVDFLVNDTTRTKPSDVIAVEMKCESLNNAASFLDGLRADLNKFENKLTGTTREQCTRVLMGVFFSRDAQTGLAKFAGINTVVAGDMGLAWLIYPIT